MFFFSKKSLLINFDNEIQFSLTSNLVYLPKIKTSYQEVIGFKVKDIKKGYIGILIDINEQSTQKKFVITFNGKKILVPIVKEFIKKINFLSKNILLECPEGLLELYIY